MRLNKKGLIMGLKPRQWMVLGLLIAMIFLVSSFQREVVRAAIFTADCDIQAGTTQDCTFQFTKGGASCNSFQEDLGATTAYVYLGEGDTVVSDTVSCTGWVTDPSLTVYPPKCVQSVNPTTYKCTVEFKSWERNCRDLPLESFPEATCGISVQGEPEQVAPFACTESIILNEIEKYFSGRSPYSIWDILYCIEQCSDCDKCSTDTNCAHVSVSANQVVRCELGVCVVSDLPTDPCDNLVCPSPHTCTDTTKYWGYYCSKVGCADNQPACCIPQYRTLNSEECGYQVVTCAYSVGEWVFDKCYDSEGTGEGHQVITYTDCSTELVNTTTYWKPCDTEQVVTPIFCDRDGEFSCEGKVVTECRDGLWGRTQTVCAYDCVNGVCLSTSDFPQIEVDVYVGGLRSFIAQLVKSFTE